MILILWPGTSNWSVGSPVDSYSKGCERIPVVDLPPSLHLRLPVWSLQEQDVFIWNEINSIIWNGCFFLHITGNGLRVTLGAAACDLDISIPCPLTRGACYWWKQHFLGKKNLCFFMVPQHSGPDNSEPHQINQWDCTPWVCQHDGSQSECPLLHS